MKAKSVATLNKEIKALEEKVTALEKSVKYETDCKDRYYREKVSLELELESVHTALDAMFVPRKVTANYSEKTMTIASRLFAWQAGARLEKQTREVE